MNNTVIFMSNFGIYCLYMYYTFFQPWIKIYLQVKLRLWKMVEDLIPFHKPLIIQLSRVYLLMAFFMEAFRKFPKNYLNPFYYVIILLVVKYLFENNKMSYCCFLYSWVFMVGLHGSMMMFVKSVTVTRSLRKNLIST